MKPLSNMGATAIILAILVGTPIAPVVWAAGGAVRGENGMVASDAPIATEVGAAVLAGGGNAMDAAVAVAFALAVVHPKAGNLGGGGFLVAHFAGVSDAALDFRETAPAAATRDMYLDSAGNPTDRSLTGALAAGVPGTVAGLAAAHARFGSRPWGELVAPAIALADTGYFVGAAWRHAVLADSARLSRFPATRALLMPEGRVPEVGNRWRDPALADVLRRIAERGAAGFYEGETADAIVATVRRDGGIITKGDLAAYRAQWRPPLSFTYRGHTVLSMPLPSSGGIALALIARLLERYDLASLGWSAPRCVHLEVEAMRRAFAVRNQELGDPDFVSVPDDLLSEQRVAALAASIRLDRATPSRELSVAPAAVPEGMHTTHFSVVDGKGNAVAFTTTLNESFGSAVTVAGGGFLLNNEMDDFTAKPGTANLYGLVQSEANAIAPGKRMLSSMSPTIVLDPAGVVRLVTGASGGPTIITSVFQVISAVLDHGMTIDQAVEAPRFHHQQFPDEIRFEPGAFDVDEMAELEALGHKVREVVPGRDAVGVACSIERRDGAWWGAADPRGGGSAAGY